MKAFGRFHTESVKSELPKGFDFEMLIFNLCEGDISKREAVESETYLDALRFLMLKRYESYMLDKMRKK
jgi:hypothetical protein